jgi:CspA family cold shock protein
MSRYKDHRGPTRRGYDEGYTPNYHAAERQPEISPRPTLTQGSEPVEASVKWFNADKGFGFVTVAGRSDAFLPSRALEAAGHSSVPDGARLKVRISQGPKGPQVAEVLEVDTSTAQVMSTAAGVLGQGHRINVCVWLFLAGTHRNASRRPEPLPILDRRRPPLGRRPVHSQ